MQVADCRLVDVHLQRPSSGASWSLSALSAMILLFGSHRATGQTSEEPPVVGRPANFSGAVGSFTIAATASPKEVQAEDPLTFTLTITAAGAVGRPPQRPNLRKIAAFDDAFYVEDLPTDSAEGDSHAWTFRYRLKPKNADVKTVPSLAFVYYTPGMLPPSRGYQAVYTDPIPLHVRPREAVKAAAVEGGRPAVEAPQSMLSIPESSEVEIVGDPAVGWRPSLLLVLLLALAPPLVSTAAYLGWRRVHPGYEAASRRRQSRAAKRALGVLRARNGKRVGDIVDVMTDYLRERFGLATAEPTPSETTTVLAKRDVGADLAANVAAYYRAFDASRFAQPSVNGTKDWLDATMQLILALEADSCRACSS